MRRNARHPDAARRAFTLVEVMLAGVLGAILVMASLGIFAALEHEQKRQKVAVREATELALTQEVFATSMQLLILSDKDPTPDNRGTPPGGTPKSDSSTPSSTDSKSTGSGSGGSGVTKVSFDDGKQPPSGSASTSKSTTDPATTTTTAGTPGSTTSAGRPRFILEEDPNATGSIRFRGRDVAPQRLEVALLAPPAFALPPEGARNTARELRQRRLQELTAPLPRDDTPGVGGDASVSTAPRQFHIAPGVRGVFELTPEPLTPRQTEQTWALSWRPLVSATSAVVPTGPAGPTGPTGTTQPDQLGSTTGSSGSASPTERSRSRSTTGTSGSSSNDRSSSTASPLAGTPGPDEQIDLGRAVLATGLLGCRWEAYKGRQFREEHTIVRSEDLPAYLRMTVETASGNSIEWIFEVGWCIGPEPGTVVQDTAAGAAGGAGTPAPATQDGATTKPGTNTTTKPGVPQPSIPAQPAPSPPAVAPGKPGMDPGLIKPPLTPPANKPTKPSGKIKERRPGRRRRLSRASRRGFALPIVVFLGFIVVLVASLLLDLQSTSRLAVDRQVRAYRHHHTSMGVRELLDQWLVLASGGIDGQLNDDGMAFQLSGDGVTTTVYLFDGQGSALRDADATGPSDALTLAQRVSQLLSIAPATDEPLLRPAGPVTISIMAAPREVLEAVVSAAGNPARAPAFAQDILSRRRDKKLAQADINDAATKAGLKAEEATAVASMFTASPELWRVEVLSTGAGLRLRQGGLMQVPPGHSLGTKSAIILSWDDLPENR